MNLLRIYCNSELEFIMLQRHFFDKGYKWDVGDDKTKIIRSYDIMEVSNYINRYGIVLVRWKKEKQIFWIYNFSGTNYNITYTNYMINNIFLSELFNL